MSDAGRVASLLFHVDRRIGFGTGFMPPSLLAWADPRGMDDNADIHATATGATAAWAGGELDSNAVLYLSTTGGRTWKDVTPRLPVTNDPITAIGANPGSAYVYVGTVGGRIFRSSNNGTSFSDVSTSAGFTGNRITAIAFNHNLQAWIGAHAGMLKFTNHSTWTNRTTELGWGATCNVLALAQKKDDKEQLMVAGTLPGGPTGKLAFTANNSSFSDRSSMIPSATQYDCLGHSALDDRFLIGGVDASTTRVYYSVDDGAHGTQIADLADSGGVSFAAFHVILDTWAAVKRDGSILRLVQDRSGDVRLADDVTEIVGTQFSFASARCLTYDPTLNRYYLGGNAYLRYTDDVTQTGAFLTRALPPGSAIIGQVQIAPASCVGLAASGLVKTGLGRLVAFLITSVNNTAHDVVFFDNTAASGTEIARVRVNAHTYGPNPISFCPAHPLSFSTGLYVSIGHGNTRVTVTYL